MRRSATRRRRASRRPGHDLSRFQDPEAPRLETRARISASAPSTPVGCRFETHVAPRPKLEAHAGVGRDRGELGLQIDPPPRLVFRSASS